MHMTFGMKITLEEKNKYKGGVQGRGSAVPSRKQ